MAAKIRSFGTIRPGKKPGTYRVGIELKPGQKIKIGDIVLTYKKPSSPNTRAYQTVTLPNKRSALNFLKEAEKQLLGGKTKLSVEQTAKLFRNKPKNQNFDEFVESLNKKYVDTYGREINNDQVRNNLLKSGLKGAGVAFEPLTKAKQRELIETYPSLYKGGYDFKKYRVGISPAVAGNYYDEIYSKAKDVSKRWPGGGDSSKNRVWQGAYRSVITGENFNKPRYKLFDVNKNRVLTPGEVDRANWAKKYKQAVFLDTDTNKKFSYDGKIKGTISLENYLNKYAVPGEPNPNRFKESVGKYDLTRKIRNIKFNAPSGKTITLGGYLDSKFRPKTLTGRAAFGSFNNHHFRDLTQNFWDTDIVFYKDNAQLNYFERPTRQALTEAAKLSGKEQNKFLKPFEKQIKQLGPIRMLEGNIELGKYSLEDALTRTFKTARIPKGTQNFLFEEIRKLNPTDLKKVCGILSKKNTGGVVQTCAQAIDTLKSNPENINRLETMKPTSAALGKVRNAARSFLNFMGLGKGEGVKIFRGERAGASGKMAKYIPGTSEVEFVPYSDKLKGRFFTTSRKVAEQFADNPSKIKSLTIPKKDFNIGTNLARRINVDQMADQLILPRSVINKLKDGTLKYNSPAFRNILRTLGKGKIFTATAAVGAGAGALVKQFRNDEPDTYLSDENQMKAMLVDTFEEDTLGKAGIGGELAAAGLAVPGSAAVYKARRLPFTDATGKTRAAMGPLRAALGPVGKAASGFATPLGMALTTPFYIANQIRQGDSLEDIATNPLNYLAPAFAGSLTKEATRGMNQKGLLARALRLGMNPATIRAGSKFFGLPGLALSLGYEGYDQYKKYQEGEGFLYNLLNKDE